MQWTRGPRNGTGTRWGGKPWISRKAHRRSRWCWMKHDGDHLARAKAGYPSRHVTSLHQRTFRSHDQDHELARNTTESGRELSLHRGVRRECRGGVAVWGAPRGKGSRGVAQPWEGGRPGGTWRRGLPFPFRDNGPLCDLKGVGRAFSPRRTQRTRRRIREGGYKHTDGCRLSRGVR